MNGTSLFIDQCFHCRVTTHLIKHAKMQILMWNLIALMNMHELLLPNSLIQWPSPDERSPPAASAMCPFYHDDVQMQLHRQSGCYSPSSPAQLDMVPEHNSSLKRNELTRK
jgi:hypothetical protein